MKKSGIISLAAGAAVLAGATIAFAYPGQQLAGQAHVSIAQARSIALRTVKGTIVAQELETEKGGSGLRYSFDVKTAGGVREVGVDAKTGAVLENSADNASAGAGAKSEKGGEAREAPGGEAGEAGGD